MVDDMLIKENSIGFSIHYFLGNRSHHLHRKIDFLMLDPISRHKTPVFSEFSISPFSRSKFEKCAAAGHLKSKERLFENVG